MVSSVSSILSRASSAPPLTSVQAGIDGGLTDFLHHATSWRDLVAMGTAGLAYRFGKLGFASLTDTLSTAAGGALRLASGGAGLIQEAAVFELTQRTLKPSPHSWRAGQPDGLLQGWISSLVAFGTLRAFNGIGRHQNLLLQHLLADTGLVAGHQALGSLNLGPRPTGTLVEQMLRAEATTLQFQAGMDLFHTLTPGLTAVIKGLDMGGTAAKERSFAPFLGALLPEAATGPARIHREFRPGLVFMTGKEEKPEAPASRESDVRTLKSGSPPAPSEPPSSEKVESGTPPFDEILKALDKTLSVPPEPGAKGSGEPEDFIDALTEISLDSSPAPLSSRPPSWEREALDLVLNPPRLPRYVKNLSPVKYQLTQLNTLLEKNQSFDSWRNLGLRLEQEMGLEAFLRWALKAAQESPDGPSLLTLFRLAGVLFKGSESTQENRLIFSTLRRMARYHPEDPVIGKIWSDNVEALPWEVSGNPSAPSEALKNLGKAGFPIPFVDTLLSLAAGQISNPESFSLLRESLHLSAYAAVCRNWSATTDPLILFLEAGYLSQRVMENGDWARALNILGELRSRLRSRGTTAQPLLEAVEHRIEALRPLVKLLMSPSFSSIHQLVRLYRQNSSVRTFLPPPEAMIRELKRRFLEFPAKTLAIQEGIRLFTRETLKLLAADLQSSLSAEAANPLAAKIAELQGLSAKTPGELQREGTPKVLEIASALMKLERYDLVYRIVRPLHSLGYMEPQSLNDRIILPILQDLDEVLGGSRRDSLLEEAATIDQELETLGPDSSGLKGTFLKSKNAIDRLLNRYEDAKERKNFEDWKAEYRRWMDELF